MIHIRYIPGINNIDVIQARIANTREGWRDGGIAGPDVQALAPLLPAASRRCGPVPVSRAETGVPCGVRDFLKYSNQSHRDDRDEALASRNCRQAAPGR